MTAGPRLALGLPVMQRCRVLLWHQVPPHDCQSLGRSPDRRASTFHPSAAHPTSARRELRMKREALGLESLSSCLNRLGIPFLAGVKAARVSRAFNLVSGAIYSSQSRRVPIASYQGSRVEPLL